MGSTPILHLLLVSIAFTVEFSFNFAESRKELRSDEQNVVDRERIIQLTRTGTNTTTNNKKINPTRVLQISWQPRVFLYKGFLTTEECDHLVSLARVANGSNGIDKNGFLASSVAISNLDDDILSRIEERISTWTFLPKENGDSIQVMHYGMENAKENLDYFGNRSTLNLNDPLMATLVLYLSNVTHGGEILFPNSKVKWSKIGYNCAKTNSVLRPSKGNALLFYNVHLNASPDTSSLHSRCPVAEGEMLVATKLFFTRAITNHVDKLVTGGSNGDEECSDEDENCPRWAAGGECQRNPVFMTGSPDYYGTCRKSCNVC